MTDSPANEEHILALDPSGNRACSMRKTMAISIFVSGLLFMGFDLWANGGMNVVGLAGFTGTGPTLYTLARGNHEYQVRKLGA